MGKAIVADPGTVLSMTGALTGLDVKAVMAKAGTGTLVLFNPANQWAAMDIEAGTVRVGAAGAMPDNAQLYMKATCAFELNGINETIG